MILVSACLLGINCKYSGGNSYSEKLAVRLEKEGVIPFCPEQLGGLTTPRPPVEIQGGTGASVLEGKGRVLSKTGEDVTQAFIRGAEESLKMAKLLGVNQAILKARSPSCGVGAIYDGTFTGTQISGDGVTAAKLRKLGIPLETEETFQ